MKKSKKFIEFCKEHEINPDEVPDVISVEAAFKARKIELKKRYSFPGIPKRFHKWLIAGFKAAVFCEAINTDENGNLWRPNYNDSNEPKYEIWWKVKADKEHPSGFGLSCRAFALWNSGAAVPARLCFRTAELAKFAGYLLPELFKDFQLIIE